MRYGVAALRGTVSLYTYLAPDKVMIQKDDYSHKTIHINLFRELYHELSGIYTALNDDCMEYIEFKQGVTEYDSYPDWLCDYFSEQIELTNNDETILYEYDYNEDNVVLYVKDDTIEAKSKSHCVLMRNKLGQFKFMEYLDFTKYYEVHF